MAAGWRPAADGARATFCRGSPPQVELASCYCVQPVGSVSPCAAFQGNEVHVIVCGWWGCIALCRAQPRVGLAAYEHLRPRHPSLPSESSEQLPVGATPALLSKLDFSCMTQAGAQSASSSRVPSLTAGSAPQQAPGYSERCLTPTLTAAELWQRRPPATQGAPHCRAPLSTLGEASRATPSHWRGPWAAPAFPLQAVEGKTCSPHLARYSGPGTVCTEGHIQSQQHLLLDGHMYFTFCTCSFWWAGWATCSSPGSNGSNWRATDCLHHQSTPSCSTCRTQEVLLLHCVYSGGL